MLVFAQGRPSRDRGLRDGPQGLREFSKIRPRASFCEALRAVPERPSVPQGVLAGPALQGQRDARGRPSGPQGRTFKNQAPGLFLRNGPEGRPCQAPALQGQGRGQVQEVRTLLARSAPNEGMRARIRFDPSSLGTGPSREKNKTCGPFQSVFYITPRVTPTKVKTPLIWAPHPTSKLSQKSLPSMIAR